MEWNVSRHQSVEVTVRVNVGISGPGSCVNWPPNSISGTLRERRNQYLDKRGATFLLKPLKELVVGVGVGDASMRPTQGGYETSINEPGNEDPVQDRFKPGATTWNSQNTVNGPVDRPLRCP